MKRKRMRLIRSLLAVTLCLQLLLTSSGAPLAWALPAAGVRTMLAMPEDYSGGGGELALQAQKILAARCASDRSYGQVVTLDKGPAEALATAAASGSVKLLAAEILSLKSEAGTTKSEIALFAVDAGGRISGAAFSAGVSRARPGPIGYAASVRESLDRAFKAALAEISHPVGAGTVKSGAGKVFTLSLPGGLKTGSKVASFSSLHVNGIMKVGRAQDGLASGELLASFSEPKAGDTLIKQSGDTGDKQDGAGVRSLGSTILIGLAILAGVLLLSGGGNDDENGEEPPLDMTCEAGEGSITLQWSAASPAPDFYRIYRQEWTGGTIIVDSSLSTAGAGFSRLPRQNRAGRLALAGRPGRNGAKPSGRTEPMLPRIQAAEGTLIADLPGDTLQYTDNDVTLATRYQYNLTVVRDGVESDTVASCLVDYDNAAPEVTVTAPAEGASLDTGDVVFTWDAEDDLSVEQELEFSWRIDGEPFSAFTRNVYQVEYDNLPAGDHVFQITARDRAGNESMVVSRSFSVEGPSVDLPPLAEILSLTPNPTEGAAAANLRASITARTEGALVAGAQYRIESLSVDDWQEMAPVDGTFDEVVEEVTADIDVSGLSSGEYQVLVRGVDDNGLFSEPVEATLVVNGGVTPTRVVPDDALRQAVNDKLRLDGGHEPTVAELQGLSGELWAEDIGVVSLEGLQYCTGLSGLRLGGNNITDLSPIAGLTGITYLRLHNNPSLSNIAPLSGLTNLSFLTIWGNSLNDISPLAGLTNMRVLSLGVNDITDISPLAGLAQLEILSLDSNSVSDISSLAGMVNLTSLDLRDNGIANLSPLVQNEAFASGNTIQLNSNPLDFSDPSGEDAQAVDLLRQRGAVVHTDYDGVITGTVRQEGLPAAGAVVLVMAGGPDDYASAVTRATTEADGSYRAAWLPGGVYHLASFLDDNANGLPDEGECLGSCPGTATIIPGSQWTANGLDMDLLDTGPEPLAIVLDGALRPVINAKLGQPADYSPTIADLQGLTGELHGENAGITSLEGLQYCTGLTGLYLSGNSISDLSPLAGLVNLEELDLRNNLIADLAPLLQYPDFAFHNKIWLEGNLLALSNPAGEDSQAIRQLRSWGASVLTN